MSHLDLATLEQLYKDVRNYHDKQWIGFLIAKRKEELCTTQA